MLREWMTLFVAGIPLDEVAFGPPPPTDGPPPPAGDAPEEEQLVVEAEIDEYLAQASEWAPDALAAAPLPDDLRLALLRMQCDVPCASTYRVVVEGVERCDQKR